MVQKCMDIHKVLMICIQSNYMEVKLRLFVVGNGFDLGHGLPTAYWDFRTYLHNMYPDFLKSFEEHYYIYPGTHEYQKRNMLWNELESNLANIYEDLIIENALGVDLDLESGDIGIEDTLYYYFKDEYNYINKLAKYLKQWVRTIRIRDVDKRTSLIHNSREDFHVTFNYTAVLETVYEISPDKIIHINGSLREKDGAPILGHGNKGCIKRIQNDIEKAEMIFDEKRTRICRILKEYYDKTFKDVNRYNYQLMDIKSFDIDEIHVIGHSVAGVDQVYFSSIDNLTKAKARWNIYYKDEKDYNDEIKQKLLKNLKKCGIDRKRIELLKSDQFFDL